MLPTDTDALVVDDDPLEVELILLAFGGTSPAGVRIETARDGEEALDFLLARGNFRHRQNMAAPRLILIDFKLPRLDGVDVLRTIRSNPRTSTAPVVMLTSSAEPRETAQWYHLGANSVVQKPVVFAEFRATIQALRDYWLGINQTIRTSSSFP